VFRRAIEEVEEGQAWGRMALFRRLPTVKKIQLSPAGDSIVTG
jgi:hypothetical protein